jgi:hypothetical protein
LAAAVIQLSLNGKKRMIGQEKVVASHSTPGRNVNCRTNIPSDDFKAITRVNLSNTLPKLQNQSSATCMSSVPTFGIP